ncbi:hypothetical protein BG003_004265, partial [Podila horticola]
MEKTHPIDIPEILTLIASFIPVWEGHLDELTFIPRDLVSCTRVSKLWRQISLPFLWEVYSARHMSNIPINVLSQNSIHFQHFYQDSAYPVIKVPRELWLKDASGEPALKCSSLKSFSLTRDSLSEQLELLRTNHGLVSLEWCSTRWDELPETIFEAIKPLATSVKDLRFKMKYCTSRTFVPMLNEFHNLERLQVGIPYTNVFSVAKAETVGVRSQTLKQLAVFQALENEGQESETLSLFHQCPRIEHLILHLSYYSRKGHRDLQSNIPLIGPIQDTVLTWRSQIRDQASYSATIVEPSLDSALGLAPPPSPRGSHQDLDRLDLYVHGEYRSNTYCFAQFQRGCQDLVGLKAVLGSCDPKVFTPLIRSFKHTLRHVDIDLGSIFQREAVFEMFCSILGTLTELRHVTLVTTNLMTKDESIALFQGQFLKDQSKDETVAETVAGGQTTGWACQRLEGLTIRGLCRGLAKDRLDKGQDTITFPAASEKHQWVSGGPTKFGKQLRATIADRIQTLPALKQLTL